MCLDGIISRLNCQAPGLPRLGKPIKMLMALQLTSCGPALHLNAFTRDWSGEGMHQVGVKLCWVLLTSRGCKMGEPLQLRRKTGSSILNLHTSCQRPFTMVFLIQHL